MKILFYSLFTSFFLLVFPKVSAQETIKTLAVYKKSVNFNFSSEWQYLSSDLYLFNTEKFSDLINQITTKKTKSGRKKKYQQDEIIQSLFIKAKIKDLKFFGGDLVYPIYNFKIKKDKNYTTQIGSNIEVIRLIDNLPLASSKDFIDAEISGEIITKKNSDDFLRLIATQLLNIAKVSQANVAILDLVGELGKFIETKTTGKQYKFSSTIRLYEDHDFSKKLHSVNIFIFAPSSIAKINVFAGNLTNYLDNSENPQIDQKKLRKLINYRKYPMMVVANYKSQYNSQPVIGDQINFEYISQRKLKISNAYKSELINKETHIQEITLIEYLELFAQLKLNINNYKLNKQNKITDDFSKNIFVIMQNYRQLINLKKQRENEYFANPVFQNEFKAKYETVLKTAKIYLELDQDLKNVKDVMALIQNKSNNIKADSLQMENDLKILHSVTFPKSELKSMESLMVKNHIQQTEQALYTGKYLPVINSLGFLPIDKEYIGYRNKLIKQASLTNCKPCKEKLIVALNIYSKKYNNEQKTIATARNDELKQKAVSLLFDMIKKKSCIENNISVMEKDSLPEYFSLFEMELNKFKEVLDKLNIMVRTDTQEFSTEAILEQNQNIKALINKTGSSYKNLCNHISYLCKCN